MGIVTFFAGHTKQKFKLSSFFGSMRAFTCSQALMDSKTACIYHPVPEELGLNNCFEFLSDTLYRVFYITAIASIKRYACGSYSH